MTTGSDPLDERQELSIDALEEAYTWASNMDIQPNIILTTQKGIAWLFKYFGYTPNLVEEDDFDDFAEWAKDVRAKHKRPKNGELRQYLDKQAGKRGRRF